MTFAVAVCEATALSFQRCLRVGRARSDARLKGRGDLVVHRRPRRAQRRAADVEAFDADDEAVVQLTHEQKELRLCPRILRDYLMHVPERRHPRLSVRQETNDCLLLLLERQTGWLRGRAGRWPGTLRSSAGGRSAMLSRAVGVRLKCPARGEMAVVGRSVVEQLDDRTAKFGVTKKLGPPKRRLLPCPSKRSVIFRPSVPGTLDVLRSNDRRAVLTFAGMSGRPAAEAMDSFGPAMFIASVKSAGLAVATALRSAVKPFLPMAARVPLSSRKRRMTSPSTATISGVLMRL